MYPIALAEACVFCFIACSSKLMPELPARDLPEGKIIFALQDLAEYGLIADFPKSGLTEPSLLFGLKNTIINVVGKAALIQGIGSDRHRKAFVFEKIEAE